MFESEIAIVHEFMTPKDGHGPVRDLSVDVVITLYGMAAVLIYMMLIGDFMSDIAPWCISVESPWGPIAIGGGFVSVESPWIHF